MADRLPIYEIEPGIVAGLCEGRRLIVSAPTGSGKSTQVPQMLLDRGLLGTGQVVILQPRRLATRLLAARVASEHLAELGGEVGLPNSLRECHRPGNTHSVRHRRRVAAADGSGPEAARRFRAHLRRVSRAPSLR
jgi:hypothetical protein